MADGGGNVEYRGDGGSPPVLGRVEGLAVAEAIMDALVHGKTYAEAAEAGQAACAALLGATDERGRINDLRGRTVREVHHSDVVIITGAEYLRMRWAQMERDRA